MDGAKEGTLLTVIKSAFALRYKCMMCLSLIFNTPKKAYVFTSKFMFSIVSIDTQPILLCYTLRGGSKVLLYTAIAAVKGQSFSFPLKGWPLFNTSCKMLERGT